MWLFADSVAVFLVMATLCYVFYRMGKTEGIEIGRAEEAAKWKEEGQWKLEKGEKPVAKGDK